jgi:GT2 family glycosyltransferase
MRKITIIILTWNGLEYTKKCLDSIDYKNLPTWVSLTIVDNGSTDGTVEFLKSLKGINLIENGENLGYGKAVNLGIQAANQDSDILLLNNDVEIISKDWLEKTLETANDPRIGVVGAKILKTQDGLIQHCGAYLPLDTLWGQQTASNEIDIGQYSGVHEVEGIVFAYAFIKRSVLNKIGCLDERFFAYFEDTDFCIRAKVEGFSLVMNGDILLKHSENTSTKINKISHLDIFNQSKEKFNQKWGHDLRAIKYPLGSIDFHSIMNFPSGYAGSSREFMLQVDALGMEVAYKYVYGPGTVFPVEESKLSDSYMVNVFSSRKFEKAKTQIVYAQGDVFEKNSGKNKIGYTMLEVTGIPREWVRQANLMDEVWVPSHFNVETFSNSGVIAPIKVIPLGIDPAYFSPDIIGKKIENKFSFLSIFEWGERKAPEVLIKAFSDEFDAKEDVILICKVNNFDPSINIPSEVAKMKLRPNGGKIIFAPNRILKNYELGILYRSADCFVLPTRGEGWGMPILEAMASGLPVIATNWGANTEFMSEKNSYQLEIEGLIPAVAKCPYYEGFQWAQPSYEHLRFLMRSVYENQNAASEIAKQASLDARENWTWKKAAEKIIARVKEIG